MASAALNSNEVQAYVYDHAQDGFRGLAVYDGDDLNVRYTRTDIEADVRERLNSVHDCIQSARRAAEDSDGDCWNPLCAGRASIQLWDDAALMHLRPDQSPSVERGILVELDPRVAASCADFVSSVEEIVVDES
ncbi:hypothetical protein [Halobacterium jilantaiense]|uniref:Roadblock/LC7 domain-containing protein n=1 Tax=Halobacterium jilantaiense TaxID=355548 RepID=A0A1I0PSI0_9EURY|nr:hypothetical protein [Halobacterium jilantaiense]SEW17365.1 hypothetical protein SAMN04487945_1917 [Halobacterium jilantaiense]